MARRTARSPPRAEASFEIVAVIGFKNSQAGVEQLSLRHDHDVETGGDLVSTENLSNQTFRSVSHDRAAELLRRRDPEASHAEAVLEDEERRVAAVYAGPLCVNPLKIGAAADPLGSREPDREARRHFIRY